MRTWIADRLESLARVIRPKQKLVWAFGCKHGYPNFVHCPKGCDD